jgi:gliding motility-associated-like protein
MYSMAAWEIKQTTNKGQCLIAVLLLYLVLLQSAVKAQCPDNIDFENGNFSGWQYYASRLPANGGAVNWGAAVPILDKRLKIISPASEDEKDYFGNFTKKCPNGSGYSVQIGNDDVNNEADKISYTFTIPPNQNAFAFSYNYALVFEDPGHEVALQPRFTVEVFNVTDNKVDPCSSFDFVIKGGLPGFFISGKTVPGRVPAVTVWCKNWAAASINLSGNAGKTFRISFSTTDCGLNGHFGYAYIDVNSRCNSAFLTSPYCSGANSITVNGPFGYQYYSWYYDNVRGTYLGADQQLTLKPPPPPGTKLAVIITPYNGYGCLDTLYTEIVDTLRVEAKAGADVSSCDFSNAIQLGSPGVPGLKYYWEPAKGLNNPDIANPLAMPARTTKYVLTVSGNGNECPQKDTVLIERPCKTLYYVPNAFTPNNDGANDVLRPLVQGILDFKRFSIYNRWGQLLYATTIPGNNGWDGKLNGVPLPQQTVAWVLEVLDENDETKIYRGTTLLMR